MQTAVTDPQIEESHRPGLRLLSTPCSTPFLEFQHHYASACLEVKPEVDNKPPRTFLHHHVQAKKIQKEQERLAEIEKNNRLLMEKIALIMRTGGTVDNWNTCVLRSINSNKRNREIVRITAENQAIHKKILDSKPYYDHKKWECEWKATRKLMQHTSSYCALTKNKWMASKFAVT
ncbi:sperm axonemal maintenance protein CFAP97D1 isoform X1 [Dendrobates tinctorius]|uniref:sperm axonemal maintenance protein CFAP97D1 isoform X1 n=1 Tax=Dendrobates tinctorius TaxID=92724 RepID=UPI003CC951F2